MRKIAYKIYKNYNIKKNYKFNEICLISNKFIIKEFGHIKCLYLYLASLPYKNNIYYSKYILRCFLTGRVRSTIKKFMLSRMILKKLALNGFLTGLKKASW